MRTAARALLAGLSIGRLLAGADTAAGRFAPIYASSSIVHAASQESGAFAPNTIITLYGKNLAYATRAITANDIRDGLMPTVLPGTGFRAYIDNVPAPLYFVSPGQVNLLVPAGLKAGVHRLHAALDAIAGPVIDFQIAPAAPGLFLQQPGLAIAVRLDGSLIDVANPAKAGDVVILFATGLGNVVGPIPRFGEVAGGAAAITGMDRFSITLGGQTVPRDHIYYAGLAPGFAGLYQINLRLPDDSSGDPEIRVSVGDGVSPAGVRLPIR